MTSSLEAHPFGLAHLAAGEVARRSGRDHHDAAIVLGSGWQGAVTELGSGAVDMAMPELPGFAAPSVPGHHGMLRSVEVAGRPVLLCIGRVHLYEGRSPAEVVHPVRTAILCGASSVVLTNAAGGLRPGFSPGQAVLIADHLNLTGTSPLSGPAPPEDRPGRFVDLSACYDPSLRALAQEAAVALGPASSLRGAPGGGESAPSAGESVPSAGENDDGGESVPSGGESAPNGGLEEGVYAGLTGPHYETPAEIRMLARLGADIVGMSTVLEAIAARHLGAAVLGISLVTNLAAGVSPAPLDHAEVLAAGQAAAPELGRLLAGIAERLPFTPH